LRDSRRTFRSKTAGPETNLRLVIFPASSCQNSRSVQDRWAAPISISKRDRWVAPISPCTNLTLHQSHPAPISTGGWFRLNAGYPFVMGGQVSPREASHLQEPLVPRWGEPIAGKTQDWWVAPISKGGWHQLEEGGPFFMGSFGRVSLGRVLSPPGTFGASMDRSDGPSKIAGNTRDRWVAPISKGGWHQLGEGGPFFMGSFGRVSLGRVLSPPGTFGASMDRSDGPSKIAGKTRDRWVAPISKGGWHQLDEMHFFLGDSFRGCTNQGQLIRSITRLGFGHRNRSIFYFVDPRKAGLGDRMGGVGTVR